MLFEKKILKRNLDLENIVIFNKSRSYREGYLMHLNFAVIDNNGNQILSFTPVFLNNETEFPAIANDICEALNNIVDQDYQIALKSHIYASNWCMPKEFKKASQSIDTLLFPSYFLSYIIDSLVNEIYEVVLNTDLYSLQTKDEFEMLESEIKTSSNDFLDSIEKSVKNKTPMSTLKANNAIENIIKKKAICNNKIFNKFSSKETEKEIAFWVQDVNKETMLNFIKNNKNVADFVVIVELGLIHEFLNKKRLFKTISSEGDEKKCQSLILSAPL